MPVIRQNIGWFLISAVIASGIAIGVTLLNPFPSIDRAMFGLFLDAVAIPNSSEIIIAGHAGWAVCANILFVIVFILSLRFAGFRNSPIVCILWSALWGAISAIVLVFFRRWFSPLTGWMMILIIYPVWHWQCVSRFLKQLDVQIYRWLKTPALLGVRYTLPEKSGWSINPIQDRFDALDILTQQIRDVRNFAHRAMVSFPGAILATDHEWRISLFNHYAAHLMASETTLYDMPLMTFLKALGTVDVVPLTNTLHDAIKENRVEAFQIKSTQNIFSVSVAPFFAENDEKIGLAVCILDVTAEHHAQQTREALMQFLSHDIRSPISSIIMAIDAARVTEKNTHTPEENCTVLLRRLRYYAVRSLHLADSFLQLSRAEAVKTEDFEPVELTDIIDVTIDGLWPQAQARRIRLTVEGLQTLPEMGAWVNANRTLLIRMMTNLVQNALTYSPDNTTVSITLALADNDWQISVRDQGQGIALTQLPVLFEKFKRLPEDGTITKDGVGLGLTIVKTIVDRHGGKIDVQSTVGQGSCFIVTIPAILSPPLDDE